MSEAVLPAGTVAVKRDRRRDRALIRTWLLAVIVMIVAMIVVGGGISGMTTALEAAETGKQVILLEKRPYLGGRVSSFTNTSLKCVTRPAVKKSINAALR